MFVNTFQPFVLWQLQLRRLYNMYGLDWFIGKTFRDIYNQYIPQSVKNNSNSSIGGIQSISGFSLDDQSILWVKQWVGRTPFVMAFSNVRFGTDETETNWDSSFKQYSVVSSQFNFNVNSDNNALLAKLDDPFDYYQNHSVFGVNPKPIITQFTMQRRTANGTLRNIKTKIVCFNHEQFLGIRDYFCVPGTTVFFQYGNMMQNISARIFKPVLNPQQLDITDSDQRFSDIYIGTKNSKKKDLIATGGMTQFSTGIVYNYQIQQNGTTFTVSINLMTQGVSQILSLIRNSSQFQPGRQSGMSRRIKQIANLTQGRTRRNLFGNQVVSIRQNTTNCVYVTLNWITNIVVQFIRSRGSIYIGNSGQRLTTTVAPGNPIVKYDADMHLPHGLMSQDPNIIIIDRFNNIPNAPLSRMKSIYTQDPNQVQRTQQQLYSNPNILRQVYNLFGITADLEPTAVQRQFQSWKDYNLQERASTTTQIESFNAQSAFLGNVYFNLQMVTTWLDNTEQIGMVQFLDFILDRLDAAVSNVLTLSSFAQDLSTSILISQRGFLYNISNNHYKISNFGNQSILREMNIRVKLPDSVKVATIASYNQRMFGQQNQIKKMFQSIFGKNRTLIDINLPSKTKRQQLAQVSEQYSQNLGTTEIASDQSNQQSRNQTTTIQQVKRRLWTNSTTINKSLLEQQGTKNAIIRSNSLLSASHKQLLQQRRRTLMYDYSVYFINVEMTLDFISGMKFGQMFKLQFNPFGWQSTFTVMSIDHTIGQTGAVTKLSGILMGVTG